MSTSKAAQPLVCLFVFFYADGCGLVKDVYMGKSRVSFYFDETGRVIALDYSTRRGNRRAKSGGPLWKKTQEYLDQNMEILRQIHDQRINRQNSGE